MTDTWDISEPERDEGEVVYCPFVHSDDGLCIGGCPSMKERACINGE